MGAGPRLHDGVGRQPRAGRPGREEVLRLRCPVAGTEGQLRHVDAHCHALEHAGELQLLVDGIPLRGRPGEAMNPRLARNQWLATVALLLSTHALLARDADTPASL